MKEREFEVGDKVRILTWEEINEKCPDGGWCDIFFNNHGGKICEIEVISLGGVTIVSDSLHRFNVVKRILELMPDEKIPNNTNNDDNPTITLEEHYIAIFKSVDMYQSLDHEIISDLMSEFNIPEEFVVDHFLDYRVFISDQTHINSGGSTLYLVIDKEPNIVFLSSEISNKFFKVTFADDRYVVKEVKRKSIWEEV